MQPRRMAVDSQLQPRVAFCDGHWALCAVRGGALANARACARRTKCSPSGMLLYGAPESNETWQLCDWSSFLAAKRVWLDRPDRSLLNGDGTRL